jgi:hypothetical protein
LSDISFKHVQNIQQLSQNDTMPNISDVVKELLKYLVSDVDERYFSDYSLFEQYFFRHPDFLDRFHHEVMMSATFDSND